MQAADLPSRIDLNRLSRGRHDWRGGVVANALTRLSAATLGVRPGAMAWVSVIMDNAHPRVMGSGQIDVELRCERCLQPFTQTLNCEFDVWVIDRLDEGEALLEHDATAEFVQAPRGILAVDALLEDEWMLALPVVARHEDEQCDGGQRHFGPVGESQPASPSPFSALEALKTDRNGSEK